MTSLYRAPKWPEDIAPVRQVGATPYNTAANTAGHLVKSGAGVLRSISINTPGLTSSCVLYDGTAVEGGVKLATIGTLAQGSLQFDLAFDVGLFMVLAGGTAADVTVGFF
jgi:hypothetical protein